MLIQTVDRGVNTCSCSLYISVLKTFGEAVFEIAQFNDEALSDSAQTSLVEGGAGRGAGGGGPG